MKRLALVLVMMSAMAVAQDIKHAPTVEQCRADQRLWLAELEKAGANVKETYSNVPETYSTLHQWIVEMDDCKRVDPENRFLYENTGSEAIAEQRNRLANFVIRQGLLQQFLAEDKAGKR